MAKAGERLGCTEALFTLGERPEQRYPEARQWLQKRGYNTTLEYLRDVSRLVMEETSLLPHGNPGTMSRREMEELREVNASMGLMVENVSPRLSEPGRGPMSSPPASAPAVRVKTLEIAGQLKVAFTTGILIGIGETREERIESLLAVRELHERYGHVQEVIIQNFRAKPDTPMSGTPGCLHRGPAMDHGGLPPCAGARGQYSGAAQPEFQRLSHLSACGDKRLGRHLAPYHRLCEPRGALAPDLGAAPKHRGPWGSG